MRTTRAGETAPAARTTGADDHNVETIFDRGHGHEFLTNSLDLVGNGLGFRAKPVEQRRGRPSSRAP
jgi:hypothetical protein